MYLLETTYLGVEEPRLWMFHNTKHCDLAQTFLYQAVFISVNLLNSAYIILRLTFSFEHHKQPDVKATELWLWHLHMNTKSRLNTFPFFITHVFYFK